MDLILALILWAIPSKTMKELFKKWRIILASPTPSGKNILPIHRNANKIDKIPKKIPDIVSSKIKDEHYFKRRIYEYEKQYNNGKPIIDICRNLNDDIDYWKEPRNKEAYADVFLLLSRMTIIASIISNDIHYDEIVPFGGIKENLDKAIKYGNSTRLFLEAEWLSAVAIREEALSLKNKNAISDAVSYFDKVNNERQNNAIEYSLFCARELALLFLGLGDTKDYKKYMNQIGNHLKKLDFNIATYTSLDHVATENIITIRTYIDLLIESGSVDYARKVAKQYYPIFLQPPLSYRLDKIIISEIYRSLYRLSLLKNANSSITKKCEREIIKRCNAYNFYKLENTVKIIQVDPENSISKYLKITK